MKVEKAYQVLKENDQQSLEQSKEHAKNERTIHTVVLILALIPMYSALNAVFGLEHSSTMFRAYILVVDVSILLIYLAKIIQGIRLTRTSILIQCAVLMLSMIALMEHLNLQNPDGLRDYTLFFLGYAPAGLFAGIALSQDNELAELYEYRMIIVCILVISTAQYTVFSSHRDIYTGQDYQNVAYLSALGVGITFDLTKEVLNRKTVNLVHLASLLAISLFLGTCCIASGGRGGIILLFCYAVCMAHWLISKYGFHLLPTVLVLSITLGVIHITGIVDYGIVWPGINRFLQLFQSSVLTSTINSATNSIDARNQLRIIVFEAIKQSPVFGYGFFNYYKVLGYYPHNIFLETLLQGGLIYTSAFSIIMIRLTRRLFYDHKQKGPFQLITTISLYAFVMLLFSGSYMIDSTFWVLLGIVSNR